MCIHDCELHAGFLSSWVLSTGGGGGGGGGGEDSPQTLQLPPQNFCQLSLTKSYNVLAKNLSAISQLQGPRNCLRMPQNHSQKAQNSKSFGGGGGGGGGGIPQTPLENRGLCLQPPSTITSNIFLPKPKTLDRTLPIQGDLYSF